MKENKNAYMYEFTERVLMIKLNYWLVGDHNEKKIIPIHIITKK